MATGIPVAKARRALHDNVCKSSPCPDPEGHARGSLQDAARRMAGAASLREAAEVAHAVVCDAEVDPTFRYRSGCPTRERHLAIIEDKLSRW